MKRSTYARIVGAVIIAGLAVTALAGCSSKGPTGSASGTGSPKVTTKAGPTALGNLAAAEASLSTMAPDAKLLVVQTAQAVTPTSTPIWAYLFGSPSTDKTYVVYATGGTSMGAQEYGKAGLKAAEWGKVPATTAWEIDSDAAYTKALAASKATGKPAQYIMGLVTYKPTESTSTVAPFVWNVQLDTSGTVGAVAAGFDVDAHTGATKVTD